MKSLKQKVIMSAVVLVFALIATIGSTYAWFTVSEVVSVSAVNINVTTEDNLLIRLYDNDDGSVTTTPTDYSQSIDNADFDDTATYSANPYYSSDSVGSAVGDGGDVLGAVLTPLTAASYSGGHAGDPTETDYDILDIDALSSIDITTPADRTRTSVMGTADNITSGGYIEIKFWLMTQSTGKTIALQDLVVSTTSGDATAVSAVRLGIKGDITANDYVYAYGANGADYGFTFLTGDPGFSSTADYNAVQTTTLGASLTTLHSTFYDTLASSSDDGDAVLGNATTILTLDTALTPELVTVRIWIEGWDAEADNDIMAAAFDVSFKFVITN